MGDKDKVWQRRFKETLTSELDELRFSDELKGRVLSQSHPKTIKERFMALMELEIEVPVGALVLPVLLMVLPFGLKLKNIAVNDLTSVTIENPVKQREIIKLETGTFYKEDLIRITGGVRGEKDQNQS